MNIASILKSSEDKDLKIGLIVGQAFVLFEKCKRWKRNSLKRYRSSVEKLEQLLKKRRELELKISHSKGKQAKQLKVELNLCKSELFIANYEYYKTYKKLTDDNGPRTLVCKYLDGKPRKRLKRLEEKLRNEKSKTKEKQQSIKGEIRKAHEDLKLVREAIKIFDTTVCRIEVAKVREEQAKKHELLIGKSAK